MSGLMVIAEHRQGKLRACTKEVVGAALSLENDVVVAVLAAEPAKIAGELIGSAPSLLLMAHPSLADYNPEAYLPVLADLVASRAPRLVLLPHTSQGMDLAPALAGRLDLPLVTDCTGVEFGERITLSRQVYSGKVVERLVLEPAPSVVLTLQPGAFAEAAGGMETEVIETPVSQIEPKCARRLLEYIRAASEDVDISAAEILVAVGRGIGKSENVAMAQELAAAIGGTVACSRPVADAGWLPKSRQVGTSGKTVRPKVYIALGISGAFQHLAGMKGADTIIAVNKDPAAPIFQVADFGVVGDCLELLPALKRALAG